MTKPVENWETDWDVAVREWRDLEYIATVWAELREKCPIPHSERYGGSWLITKYDDALNIAGQPGLFQNNGVRMNENRDQWGGNSKPGGSMPPLSSNPPYNADSRRPFLKFFVPDYVDTYESYIRESIVSMIDGFEDGVIYRLDKDLADRVPNAVLAKLCSLTEEQAEIITGLGSTAMGLNELSDEDRIDKSIPALELLDEILKDRRLNPTDDLPSAVLQLNHGGVPIDDFQAIGSFALIAVSITDTTKTVLRGAFRYLAENPEEFNRLKENPELITTAVEEFLRFYAPNGGPVRLVNEDTEFQGCPMKKDDWVFLGYAIANRDPEKFERPDEVILDRFPNQHLTFGHGIHKCVGSAYARMEIRLVLEEFTKRVSSFEYAEDAKFTRKLYIHKSSCG